MAYSDLPARQRRLLEQCVDAFHAHGCCGVKVAEVDNQAVAGLLRRGLATIEKRRSHERVVPTEDGIRIANYLKVHRLGKIPTELFDHLPERERERD